MRDGHPHIGRRWDAGFFPITILYQDLCRIPLQETLGKRKLLMIKCTVLMQIEFCRGFIIRKRDGWGACTEELAGQQSVVRESRRSAPVSGAPDITEKASKFAARNLSGDASLPCTGQAGSYSVGSFTPASRKASLRSTHVPHFPQWTSEPL